MCSTRTTNGRAEPARSGRRHVCSSLPPSQRPNFSRPRGSFFSFFFSDKWLLFIYTTPIQPSIPITEQSSSSPMALVLPPPPWRVYFLSFLPLFSWGLVIGVPRSVSRFLLVKRDSRIAWGLLFLDGMPSLLAVIVFGFIGGIFPLLVLVVDFAWCP